MKDTFEKIKNDGNNIKEEAKEKTLGYILTALGLVAGLAWNEAIKDAIDSFFPNGTANLLGKLIYALVITTFVVILSFYLAKIFKSNQKK